MGPSIDQKTPMEFFKERVDEAISHQKVDPSETSRYYLTQLLEAFIRPDALYAQAGVASDEPLGKLFCEAAIAGGRRRYLLFRLTGDLSLFLSGFLSESLVRSPVSPGFYVDLGGQAYGVISQEHPRLGELFAELAANFGRFADILAEVSEKCALTDDANLLRLYERWLSTGSERSAEVLRERGILVVPSSDAVH